LRDGSILAAWFGGTAEANPDSSIRISHRRDNTWTPPRKMPRVSGKPHWNPVLFLAPDNTLRLYFKAGDWPSTWSTWLTTSRDDGATWTQPTPLENTDNRPCGPVKNKPVILHDGTWLAPNSVETTKEWDAFVDISTDGGFTWSHSQMVPIDHDTFPGLGIIQPTLWETRPGHVHMLLRSSAARVCRSDSTDGGRTWSPVRQTGMPGPNSGLDLAQLADGALALVFNPVADHSFGSRSPLTIALSTDNGETWPRRLDIETQRGAEFSYPAIIALRNGDIAITYTWKRQRIAFWQGSPKQIP
jgi:predicted neuraminidase